MAKHDIVVLNTTSSGFETDLGNNIARIKGTADDLFSVRNSSEVNKFAVSSVDDSMIIDGDLTLTGNLSSSLNSTASFGKIVATKFVGDATQMTNTNQTSHVSSSKQLEARISGAFTAGFTTTGDISGSVTSTGSFTKVVANTYVGSGAQLFDPPATPGQLSGSAQIASNISGSFTSGFVLQSKTVSISGSGTSTGSFGTLVTGTTVGLQSTISDTSGFTGLPSFAGFISSSAQLASQISGSFNKGFGYSGLLGTETPIATATQSIKLDESDDFLKINPIFVSGSEGDDKLYGERRFTLSMWLKFNADNGGRQTFIMAGAQSGALSGMYLWMQSNSIRGQFKIKQGSTMQTADLAGIGGIEIGKWHHLLLSYESNRPTPNVSGSFLTVLDGRQKTFEVMQSGSYITTSFPPGGGSTIGTYNVSSENTNMTIADITMWKHSIQSASSDAGVDSGSLITTLFNHGIVPDYNASFSTDYPDAYREKLKFAYNFDSSSYAGGSYSMYDRTGNIGFPLTSNNVDEGKIVSGSGDYPTEGVFYTTGSFGRVDGIVSITGDASQVTGLPIPTNSVSGSAQLASNISGSFNKGFEFDNSISGSATSTGSFSRLNFNSFSVTDASGITGHEAGHASASSVIAAGISASFQGGFDFNGTISGSSPSELRVHNLNLGGTFTFGSTNLIKNWDSSYVRTATFGNSLGTAISGAFQSGFGFKGTISGSATSTGSFSKIKSQKLFVKEMVGKRKPISGSMNHDNYVTASYKTDSHGRITIPTFGRGHTMNTQQFTATGSMEDQKYRARAGQLFIDNFGRLNMTVQTGSLVEVPGAWTEGPTPPTKLGGTYQAAGTRDAFIIGGGNNSTSSMVFDGISYSDTKSLTAKHGNTTGTVNLGAGTVDSAAFIFDTAGGNGVGAPGFSNIPAHTDWHEEWDGVSWSRCTVAIPDSGRNKGAAKGSANAHLIWGGTDSPGHHTMCWNGATWQSVAPAMTTTRGYTSGFGPSDSAVAAGGAGNTSGTCTEEWNGVSWSTGNALPEIHQSGGGMGNSQNAGLVMGNTFPNYHYAKRAHSYNGTSWSEEVDLPIQHQRPATGGTAARGFGAVSSGDPWGKTTFWTGGFITGSVETYNKFSQNSDGRYLLTKKLQANYSPGTSGGGSTSNGEDFGGGY